MTPLGAGGQEQAAGVPVLREDGEVGAGGLAREPRGYRVLVEAELPEFGRELVEVPVGSAAARGPAAGGLDQFFRCTAPSTART